MTSGGGGSGLIGAILAGGRSSRMGTDKALVGVGGRPMIEWVATALDAVTDDVVVVGRDEPVAGIRAIPDLSLGSHGPLAGLAAALRYASGKPVVLVAVDQPLVRPGTLQRLAGLLDRVPVVPVDDGVRQSTCAAYPGEWAEEAAAEDRDGGSIQSLFNRLPHRRVEPPEWTAWGEDGRSWHSVDTPGAAASVLRRFGLE